MNTPPKYPRTFHWPHSETVHEDDSYTSFTNRFVNAPVVITEKLDGGNTLLFEGEVYARSTGQPSRDGWMGMVRKYHAWKTHKHPGVCFYGEDLSAEHSIRYSIPEDQTYYLFAVREGDHFASWDEVKMWAEELEVYTVPVIHRGCFKSIDELTKFMQEERKKPSKFGLEREGFVIRNQNSFHADDFERNVVKYVRENHVQTDQHWRKNWKWNDLSKI